MRRRVVITGMGMITPLGNNVHTTWQGSINGRSGIGYITQFDAATFPVRIAGEVKNFSPDLSILPKDCLPLTGRSVQLCLEAARMALSDAGIDLSRENPQRIGISLGADEEYLHFKMIEDIFSKDYIYQAFKQGQEAHCKLLENSPLEGKLWSFRKKGDTGTSLLALRYGIKGPAETSHTACSSSGHALGKAKRLIENGDCDMVITGGHSSMLSEFALVGFYLLGTLSTYNDDPQKASRPFDRKRNGFVMSEGAGLLIVEELSHALKRGARIYAKLSGYGCSSNAYRITDSPPDGSGGDLSMQRALQDAQKNPEDIDYINAHGTATILNDKSETLSIKHVFGERAYAVPISSSKSMLGHLVNSSSAVELIISAMAIKESLIPPTINLEERDPECDLDYVPNVAREQRLKVVLSNSFAFGGQNATLIIEQFNG